jgi:hypothetical protein
LVFNCEIRTQVNYPHPYRNNKIVLQTWLGLVAVRIYEREGIFKAISLSDHSNFIRLLFSNTCSNHVLCDAVPLIVVDVLLHNDSVINFTVTKCSNLRAFETLRGAY